MEVVVYRYRILSLFGVLTVLAVVAVSAIAYFAIVIATDVERSALAFEQRGGCRLERREVVVPRQLADSPGLHASALWRAMSSRIFSCLEVAMPSTKLPFL